MRAVWARDCGTSYSPPRGVVLAAGDHGRTFPGDVHDRRFMAAHRIYTTSFASVYPHYVAKAERKGRTKAEVDEIIRWLTGYSHDDLQAVLDSKTDFQTFFDMAPLLNPDRTLIRGVVCGIRVEDIEEPTMREIRYLDKLVDELARGKAMEKVLRKA